MDKLKTYEEYEETNRKLAQKIWNIPFASSNLYKLTKKELLILIDSIIEQVSWKKEEWWELDIKDLMFERKCYLIECLDNDFFKREEK